MTYVRITLRLRNGQQKTGIRHFPEPVKLTEIRAQALALSAQVLGRGAIDEVTVQELPPDDPGVVAYILHHQSPKKAPEPITGRRSYPSQENRRPPR